jgi:hypothetical protein
MIINQSILACYIDFWCIQPPVMHTEPAAHVTRLFIMSLQFIIHKNYLNCHLTSLLWCTVESSYIKIHNMKVIWLYKKVKPTTHLWRHRGKRRYSSYSFTTSALDGGWVFSVTPQPRFTPEERTSGTHWTGGWVGLRAGLDTGNILCLLQGSNLYRAVIQPVARHYTAWATPAPFCYVAVFK